MTNNSIFNNQKQPVYNNKGRVVGYIDGKKLFKSVASSKHMLQRPRGWAWDADILEEAERQGVTHVEIYDKETGKTYIVPIKDFWERGIGFNRGYGEQIVCPINYWKIINPGDHPAQQLPLAI